MSASLIGPAGALRDQPVVGAAAARIDDDALAGQSRTGPADQLLLADGVHGAAGDPGAEEVQGAQRLWAADAVRRQPVLALVGHQPVVGLQPEVSVHQPGVEAEVLQPRLQGGDVVAVHRRAELVAEDARPEPVGGLFQRAVRRFADDAVDEQAPVLLKCADGLVEFEVEIVQRDVLAGAQVRIRAVHQPQRRQCRPDLGNRTPAVTATQTRHNGAFRSRISAAVQR